MQTHKIRVMITDENAEVLEFLDVFVKSETQNTAAARVREIIEHRFETDDNDSHVGETEDGSPNA